MPILVAVTGASGAGKSTLVARLAAHFGERAVVISQDSYYLGQQPGQSTEEYLQQDFDDPAQLALTRMYHHLILLKNGISVKIPSFNMKESFYSIPDSVEVHPADIIFIEGVLVLQNEHIANLVDVKFFLKIPTGVAIIRRIKRDEKERNLDPSFAIQSYEEKIFPSYAKYTKSNKNECMILNGMSPNFIEDAIEIIQKTHDSATYESDRKGRVFLIIGPSGVGKTTILKAIPSSICERLITYTTRQIRSSEIPSKDYYFVDHDTFFRMLSQELFLTHISIGSNRYGAPKNETLTAIQAGRNLIIDVSPNAAREILEKIPEAVTIFLHAGNNREETVAILTRRMQARGDSRDEIAIRLDLLDEFLAFKDSANCCVDNSCELDSSIEATISIIMQSSHHEKEKALALMRRSPEIEAKNIIEKKMKKGDISDMPLLLEAWNLYQAGNYEAVLSMFVPEDIQLNQVTSSHACVSRPESEPSCSYSGSTFSLFNNVSTSGPTGLAQRSVLSLTK